MFFVLFLPFLLPLYTKRRRVYARSDKRTSSSRKNLLQTRIFNRNNIRQEECDSRPRSTIPTRSGKWESDKLPLYPVLQEILKDDSPQRGNNGRSGGGLNTDLRIRVSPPIRSRREGFHLELLARKCSKLILTFA